MAAIFRVAYLVAKYKITLPTQMLNLDETGFADQKATRKYAVAARDTPALSLSGVEHFSRISTVSCVSADGIAIPDFHLVTKNKLNVKSCTPGEPGSLILETDSGTMNNEVWNKYGMDFLCPRLKEYMAAKGITNAMLFLDG